MNVTMNFWVIRLQNIISYLCQNFILDTKARHHKYLKDWMGLALKQAMTEPDICLLYLAR